MKLKRLAGIFLSLVILFLGLFIYMPQEALAQTGEYSRLAGSNRYETAVEISKAGWQQSDFAVLATGGDFPDALCASPLAKKYDAPILLTSRDALDEKTEDELGRLKVKEVLIVGGTGAISMGVQEYIEAMGIKCTRIFGSNRYETSVEVARYLGTGNGIVVATGSDFPDALSIAPIAAGKGMPILLSGRDTLPDIVKEYLGSQPAPMAYIIGGTGVIADKVMEQLPAPERIGGTDRYGTNLAVFNRFADVFKLDLIYMATGRNFPDALAGSVLAANTMSPVMLVDGSISSRIRSSIEDRLPEIGEVGILGGEGVVSASDVMDIVAYEEVNEEPIYTLVDDGNYEYVKTVTITNNGTLSIYDMDLEIDMGTLNASPYQIEEAVTILGEEARITVDDYGKRAAKAAVDLIKPGESVEYQIVRTFKNGGIRYSRDLSQTAGDYSSFKDYNRYTAPEDMIESDNEAIRDKAREIVGDEQNPYMKAKKIFEFVNTELEYDTSEGNKGALSALTTGKGVCEDFADLFVAMARASGIPARIVTGYWLESIDQEEPNDVSPFRHAWAEFYLPEYGWVVAEPTIIKTSIRDSRVPAYEYFANLDEPGHFIHGYSGEPVYSMTYYSDDKSKPDIVIDVQEYLRKL